jgi:hypothetical protein
MFWPKPNPNWSDRMKLNLTRSIAAASLVLGLATAVSTAYAQTPLKSTGLTRAQVQMDRDTFLATMRWDESMSAWVMRDDVPMPAGVPSKAEVMAMADKFMSMHTYDGNKNKWVPVTGSPRDLSKLSRAQVEAETIRFLKMYRFDESMSQWVEEGL